MLNYKLKQMEQKPHTHVNPDTALSDHQEEGGDVKNLSTLQVSDAVTPISKKRMLLLSGTGRHSSNGG